MSSHSEVVVGPGDPPHVHHMDTATAYQAAKLGMWLFLATEILLFGGLFVAFAIYQWMYPAQFHAGSKSLNWVLGSVNTVVLIGSSFAAALAVDAAQKGNNQRVTKLLLGTIACGGIFLVIKYFEYKAKFDHGLWPQLGGPNGIKFEEYRSFFTLYFCMTGLHAFHVIIGMGLLAWVASKSAKNRFSARYYTPVEVGALYWHLVDLIWIYLFPLLYLVG
jgi:cytochrome c oxidase subunit 3